MNLVEKYFVAFRANIYAYRKIDKQLEDKR